MIKYSEDEFIITGTFNDSLYLVKMNASGGIIWEKYYYESGGSFGAGIDKDEFGNIYVIVWKYSSATMWKLFKFDASGDTLWSWDNK